MSRFLEDFFPKSWEMRFAANQIRKKLMRKSNVNTLRKKFVLSAILNMISKISICSKRGSPCQVPQSPEGGRVDIMG